MPAPLGRTPTRKMPKIEVFGTDDSPASRAALRFFRERRIVPIYVDLRRRPIARDELRWFAERLGVGALLEARGPGGGMPARDGAADMATAMPARDGPAEAPAATLARLAGDVRLLRLPLVRHGRDATAGPAEAIWRAWLTRR